MRALRISFRLLTFLFALVLPLVAAAPKEAPKKSSARHDQVYVCACGADCTCTTVKAAPGKCSCGKDLKASHVLRVENDDALVCACEAGCTCKLDAKDATKCGCGKAVKRVNLKGTGIYFCNCGGTCECNTLSTKPGKCKCGMALKKSA